ncbi:SDR family oxidoreductase [Streptomyces niveus]|uniref:SDR family oxidoreductase n=1 Tax=Streptomyces niveus TaxID=193462 RepID=UPI002E28299E|nr:SDR family oxidoreductase [Streptomyces niveus]
MPPRPGAGAPGPVVGPPRAGPAGQVANPGPPPRDIGAPDPASRPGHNPHAASRAAEPPPSAPPGVHATERTTWPTIRLTRSGLGSYTSSKGGVTGLVQAAAIENGTHGIRVVALAPGMGEWAVAKAEFGRQGIDALRRMATPDEMASAALGLASPDFAFQTGSVLVDGGQLAGI